MNCDGDYACMPKYRFDLIGELAACDITGHECMNDTEARRDGDLLAHRLVSEKPSLLSDRNFIIVRNDKGDEIYRAPLVLH